MVNRVGGFVRWTAVLAACWTLAFAAAQAQPAAPEAKAPAPDKITTTKGDLVVRPLNHGTLALELGDVSIYVDPVGGASRFQGIDKPDLILITDVHGDHLDAATVRAVATDKTVIVAPDATRKDLEQGAVGSKSSRVVANGQKVELLGIGITAVPMYNLTAERLQFHAKGRGNGYVLDIGDTRVYLSGDTEDIPEMRKLADIDVAFVCMNLPFTMTAEQAASAVLEMAPKIVYPYHYRGPDKQGWQDPEKFKSLVEAKSKAIDVRLRDWYALK